MRLLLDTHVWIWSLLEPERLWKRAVEALGSDSNEIWLSPISVWETLILIERGRLEVDAEPGHWVRGALEAAPLREAPLTHEVSLLSRRLRLRHADPADRFLGATAIAYDLTLVTADDRLRRSKDLAVLPYR